MLFLLLLLQWGLNSDLMLGRCSTTLANSLALFVFVIFQIGSCFESGLAWIALLLFVLS
jgi:hypothetical protein